MTMPPLIYEYQNTRMLTYNDTIRQNTHRICRIRMTRIPGLDFIEGTGFFVFVSFNFGCVYSPGTRTRTHTASQL